MKSHKRPTSDDGMICLTRAYKNAKYVRRIASHIISGQPITSFIPSDTLARLHSITNPQEIIKHKELAGLVEMNRPKSPSIDISGPLFNGTLHFIQITFNTPNGTFFVSQPDVQTAIDYARHAVIPISKYALQYGQNTVNISNTMIQYSVNLSINEYRETQLKEWVVDIAQKNHLPTDGSACIILMINPDGPQDSDRMAPPGFRISGFHGSTSEVSDKDIPFCFSQVFGTNLTIDDRQNKYAQTLSHEIAEMVVDPFAREENPEVCDACAGNCRNNYHSFFDVNDEYLDSRQDFSLSNFTYYINSIVKRNLYNPDDQCTVPPADPNQHDGCAYPPP